MVVVQGLPSFDDISPSDFHGSKLGPLVPHSGLPAAFNPIRVQWKDITLGNPNPDPLRPSVLGRVSLR